MKKSEIMRYKVEIMTYPVNYPVWTNNSGNDKNTKLKMRYKVEMIKYLSPNYKIKRWHYEIKRLKLWYKG